MEGPSKMSLWQWFLIYDRKKPLSLRIYQWFFLAIFLFLIHSIGELTYFALFNGLLSLGLFVTQFKFTKNSIRFSKLILALLLIETIFLSQWYLFSFAAQVSGINIFGTSSEISNGIKSLAIQFSTPQKLQNFLLLFSSVMSAVTVFFYMPVILLYFLIKHTEKLKNGIESGKPVNNKISEFIFNKILKPLGVGMGFLFYGGTLVYVITFIALVIYAVVTNTSSGCWFPSSYCYPFPNAHIYLYPIIGIFIGILLVSFLITLNIYRMFVMRNKKILVACSIIGIVLLFLFLNSNTLLSF